MAADVRFILHAGPAAPREARRRIAVLDQLAPAAVADAQLVANELITNSLLHADLGPGGRIEVILRVTDDYLLIEVDDHGPFTRAELARSRRPGGVGLRILDRICDHWDAQRGRVTARINLTRYRARPRSA